jgi:hypothetical protein
MSATKNQSIAIPSASEIEIDMDVPEQEVQEDQELSLEEIIKHLSDMDATEIMEMIDKANGVLKKKWKQIQPTESKLKKLNKPKKPASKALKRNQAWIPFVLKHATDNGWESFTIQQTTKDKTTGQTVNEIVERSGSTPNTINYTYKDAKTGQIVTPAFIFEDTQKHLIYKDAMSLSAKLRYTDDEKTVTSDLFNQFLAEYEEPEEDESESSSSSSSSSSTTSPSSPAVVRMTAAEKELDKQRKQKEKEDEKEQKRLEKEAEKERKRKEKEEEKEQKRLEKEKEKEADKERKRKEKEADEERKRKEKEEKEQSKKSSPPAVTKKVILAKKSTASSSSSSSSSSSTASEPAPTPAPAPVPVAAKPAVSAKVTKAVKTAPKNIPPKPVEFNIPNDGFAHKWEFEGKLYMANSDGYVWTRGSSGDPDEWVGIYYPAENRLDTSAPEPEYE